MKPGEIIRIIIFTVIGWGLMVVVQPLLYKRLILKITTLPVQDWITKQYIVAAYIVFTISVLATVVWYFSGSKITEGSASEITKSWSLIWWVLFAVLIATIIISIGIFNKAPEALLSLTGLFILDSLLLLYWLPTATSSPGLIKNIPPGAKTLNSLFNR